MRRWLCNIAPSYSQSTRWFVPDDVVDRTLLGGDVVQAAELRDNILNQACDTRAAVDEIQSYFETAAWNAFLQWRDVFSDNNWTCSRCGSNTAASGTHRKWIQCDHCLAWIHFQCAALTRKPRGYYFCDQCKWVTRPMYRCALSLVPNFYECLHTVNRMPCVLNKMVLMTWIFLSIVLYIYVLYLCCFVTDFFTFVLDAVCSSVMMLMNRNWNFIFTCVVRLCVVCEIFWYCRFYEHVGCFVMQW